MAGIDNLKPFKPGYDERRGSKPKGAIHLSTHIQNLLNDPEFEIFLEDRIDGYKRFEGTPMKAIITVAVRKAAAGDEKAREWLAKYGYGQKVDLTTNGESINPYAGLSTDELRRLANDTPTSKS